MTAYDVYYNPGSNDWRLLGVEPAEAVLDLIYNALKNGYELRQGFNGDLNITITLQGQSDDRVWVIRPSKGNP